MISPEFCGHGGGKYRGCAVAKVRKRRRAHGFRAVVHKVRAPAAMNVNIDKSRQKDIPAQIDFFRAGVEFRVLIGSGDFKNFAAFYENRFIGANTVF